MRKPEELLDLIQQSETPECFINQVSYEELKMVCRFLDYLLKSSLDDESRDIFQKALDSFQYQLQIRRDLN